MPRRSAPPRLVQERDIYCIRWWDGDAGRTRRISLGTNQESEARMRFAAWLMETNGEPGIIHEYTGQRGFTSVDTVLSYYFTHHAQPKNAAADRTKQCIARLAAYFGNSRMKDITTVVADNYIAARRSGQIGMPSGDGTIRRELAVLTAAANFALKNRVLTRAELPTINLPPAPPPRDFVLTRAQVQAVFTAARQIWVGDQWRDVDDAERLPRIYRFVVAAYFTASRPTAIEQLKWSEQINLEGDRIRLNPPGRRQTRKRRPVVPIATVLRQVLERAERERKSDWYLDTPGKIERSHETLSSRLGIKELTPYVWRHTRATHLVEAGVSLEKVAALLGDNIATVERNYLHLKPDYLADTVDV